MRSGSNAHIGGTVTAHHPDAIVPLGWLTGMIFMTVNPATQQYPSTECCDKGCDKDHGCVSDSGVVKSRDCPHPRIHEHERETDTRETVEQEVVGELNQPHHECRLAEGNGSHRSVSVPTSDSQERPSLPSTLDSIS